MNLGQDVLLSHNKDDTSPNSREASSHINLLTYRISLRIINLTWCDRIPLLVSNILPYNHRELDII